MTLLPLFAVPVVYTLLDDLVNRLRRGRRPAPAHVTAAPPRLRDPEPVAAD